LAHDSGHHQIDGGSTTWGTHRIMNTSRFQGRTFIQPYPLPPQTSPLFFATDNELSQFLYSSRLPSRSTYEQLKRIVDPHVPRFTTQRYPSAPVLQRHQGPSSSLSWSTRASNTIVANMGDRATEQSAYINSAVRAVQNKRQIPEIDFTLHTMEDGTQVSTQERVCKGESYDVDRCGRYSR